MQSQCISIHFYYLDPCYNVSCNTGSCVKNPNATYETMCSCPVDRFGEKCEKPRGIFLPLSMTILTISIISNNEINLNTFSFNIQMYAVKLLAVVVVIVNQITHLLVASYVSVKGVLLKLIHVHLHEVNYFFLFITHAFT